MGSRPTDGVAMGLARKRGERATDGCEGRQERRPESPLCDGRPGKTLDRHGARWEQGAKKGGRRGWERAEPLGVEETLGGVRPPEWKPEKTGLGGEEGGREASRVEENPGGGRQEVGGGVELSPDDSTCH